MIVIKKFKTSKRYKKNKSEGNGCFWVILFFILAALNINSKHAPHAKVNRPIKKNILTEAQLENLIVRYGKNASVNSNGETPLILACKYNYIAIAKKLLANNCSPNVADKYGQTPLFVAMKKGSREIVKVILEHNPSLLAKTKKGSTILHLAAKYNFPEVAKACIKAGADLDIKTNGRYWTPLQYATYNGNLKIAVMLKEAGADITARHYYGWTALDFCKKKYPEIAKYLGGTYLNPELIPGENILGSTTNNNFETIIQMIKNRDDESIVRTIKAMNNNNKFSDKFGRTLLMISVQCSRKNISRVLFGNGADIFAKDIFDNSVLHWAVAKKDHWLEENLIKNNANINCQNIRGDTPVHIAVKNNDAKSVSILLNNQANITIKNNKGKTVFDLVKNSSSAVKELVYSNAEATQSPIPTKGSAEVEIKYSGNN